MSDSVHEVGKNRFLEVTTSENELCYSCTKKSSNLISIGVSYAEGGWIISFCPDCITMVKNGINRQIREQKKNG